MAGAIVTTYKTCQTCGDGFTGAGKDCSECKILKGEHL